MAREFRHALDDILDAINGIEATVSGKTLAHYQREWTTKHAVQRGIEIISEASRILPEDVKQLHPEILWPRVRAIGNVLRHEYHGLSDTIIWRVVTDELPALRAAVEDLLRRFGEDMPGD